MSCRSKGDAIAHNFLETSDGSILSYYSLGAGPGLIIVHGSVTYGLSHLELAKLLSPRYTVHLLSRRGRGLSGPYPDSVMNLKATRHLVTVESDVTIGGQLVERTYNEDFAAAVIATELGDLELLIETTGSMFVLGISSGALLVLTACMTERDLGKVEKAVAFEPPMQFQDLDTGLDVKSARRFEEEMARGDVSNALVTAMNIVQLGPKWIPRPIMRLLTNLLVWSQGNTECEDGKASMVHLAPTLSYDFAVVEHMIVASEQLEKAAKQPKILLLDGANSPAYIKVVMSQLERVLKGAIRATIDDAGHEVLCNKDFRGSPAKATGIIQEFLS